MLRARRDRLQGRRAASAIRQIFDAERKRLEHDADQLLALLKEISDRIGGPCVTYNERGEVFVHPDLAREFEKPGNELLSENLLKALRTDPRARRGQSEE